MSTESTNEIFAAYISDELTRELTASVVGQMGLNSKMVFQGGIGAAARALGAMKCPSILLLDVSESVDPVEEMQSLAEVCEEDTIVVALGEENDVALYRKLMTCGVQDYLVKPLTADDLRDTLNNCIDFMNEAKEEEAGPRIIDTRQVVIIGTRGGLGTSTIATNLSLLFSKNKVHTSLLDLDVYFGTTAMMFNLEPGRGLADAIENPARVDSLFLERAVVKPNENLSLLSMEAPFGLIPNPPQGAVSHLINALGDAFDAVVVDAPRPFLADNHDALEAATDIVVVTDFSLIGARDAIRILSQVSTLAPEADVHLVANRVGPVDEVQQKDFENSVERDVDIVISEDRKSIIAAAQKDGLIVETDPGSKLAGGISALYNRLMSDGETVGEEQSFFKKLFAKG